MMVVCDQHTQQQSTWRRRQNERKGLASRAKQFLRAHPWKRLWNLTFHTYIFQGASKIRFRGNSQPARTVINPNKRALYLGRKQLTNSAAAAAVNPYVYIASTNNQSILHGLFSEGERRTHRLEEERQEVVKFELTENISPPPRLQRYKWKYRVIIRIEWVSSRTKLRCQ